MTPASTVIERRAGSLPARRQMKKQQDSRTVLLMRKQAGSIGWPYQEFNRYLNELMIAAGVPLSSQGTPNTVVFEEITGIDPGRVSRWRTGKNQPTVESLRLIAEGIAPRIGMDPSELLITLEVKAGRRSEAEARASGARANHEPMQALDDLDRRIRVLRIALDRPSIKDEERRELEIELVRAQATKRMNEDAINAVDRVLHRYGHSA